MPVLSTRIVLDCFYLLIFYPEKFSTDVCRLPYAVNVYLNLSIEFVLLETCYSYGTLWQEKETFSGKCTMIFFLVPQLCRRGCKI